MDDQKLATAGHVAGPHAGTSQPGETVNQEHGPEDRAMRSTFAPDLHAILLIDDNAVQAATRQTILKRAGYFVIAVLNPRRALEQFQAQDFPAEIRLVITDHLMPGMTGAEFVTELRKSHPELPVLVISGLEEAEDLYGGLNVMFRMKPLLPDHLLASVHRLVS